MTAFERIRDGSWDGQAFRTAIVAGDMPEYHGSSVVPSVFDFPAGECPYHLESLVDHVTGTVDAAIRLADRFRVGCEDRVRLVSAATWHDVGKLVTRVWKDRWVCPECGRSHSGEGACRTRRCPGIPELRSVVGYHGHAPAGASEWLWGNIGTREGVPDPLKRHVGRMILWHSDVHDRIIRVGRGIEDAMSVLLSWADEVAKVSPTFVHADDERPMRAFERAYARAAGSEGGSSDEDDATESGGHA